MKGLKIGVQGGATSQTALENSDLAGKNEIIIEDENISIMNQIADGTLDAALVDSIFAYYYISMQNENFFLILPGELAEEDLAIGFRKDDLALRDKVQYYLDEMKEDGTLSRISRKWFGTDITL